MTVRIACPFCSATVNDPDQAAWKSAKCPRCGGAFVVPPEENPGALAAPGVEEDDDRDGPRRVFGLTVAVLAAVLAVLVLAGWLIFALSWSG
jgi:hypothetical protein